MSKFVKGAAVALVSAGLIAGTVAIPQANAVSYVCKYEQKKSGRKGAVIGAIAGGLLGSQVSKNERGLGAVGGAVIGGVVGNKIGKNNAKRKCVEQAAYRSETHYRKLPNGRYEKVVYRYVRE